MNEEFQELRETFLAGLWETDPTAAIAYEQLYHQRMAGKLGISAVGMHMRVFGVKNVPEDTYEA